MTRFKENPIIRPEMLPEGAGESINGPSLIKVPDWIEKPLGKYYLYFSHHKGPYIRLTYADQLAGPWKVYEPGTLSMQQLPSAALPVVQASIQPAFFLGSVFGGRRYARILDSGISLGPVSPSIAILPASPTPVG